MAVRWSWGENVVGENLRVKTKVFRGGRRGGKGRELLEMGLKAFFFSFFFFFRVEIYLTKQI
jgi:hypothetical protein